jgi:hypothetical protein
MEMKMKKTKCLECKESSTGHCKKHPMPAKGPGGTPKPDRKKKVDPNLEKIEAINITLSVERLAGWTKEDLVKHLTTELTRVAECLGGDHGPRFNVEAGPNTIVEILNIEPWWRTIDIEPIAKSRS